MDGALALRPFYRCIIPSLSRRSGLAARRYRGHLVLSPLSVGQCDREYSLAHEAGGRGVVTGAATGGDWYFYRVISRVEPFSRGGAFFHREIKGSVGWKAARYPLFSKTSSLRVSSIIATLLSELRRWADWKPLRWKSPDARRGAKLDAVPVVARGGKIRRYLDPA